MHRGVGGGEEGGEEGGGRSKVEMCHVWIVGQATSSSKVYAIYVQRTYVEESLLGLLHGVGKPGQGFRDVGCWRLNDTLNDIVLTVQYTDGLESARIEVWGAARKAVRRGEGSKLRCATCGRGSGDTLQQGLCDICATHVCEEVTPGVATWCG